MRVVLDTNVLVSALIAPAGNPAADCACLAHRGHDPMCPLFPKPGDCRATV